MQKRLDLADVAMSICWFWMDICWMRTWTWGAKALIVPTIILCLFTFRYVEKLFIPVAITGAMSSWLLMNIVWMVGDLDKKEDWVKAGNYFALLGTTLLLSALVFGALKQREVLWQYLSRFRRMRIRWK